MITDDDDLPPACTTDEARAVREYYEAEAELGLRRPLKGWRVQVRTAFIALLDAEQRCSVVDFGAGPGHDARELASPQRRCVGLDVAIGNARAAALAGLVVVPADVRSVPFRDESFDAAWSMSTLMHLDPDAMRAAVGEMARVVVPGAPVWVGVWGGPDSIEFDESIEGQRRVFHRRSRRASRELIDTVFDVRSVEHRTFRDEDYHLFCLRRR